MRRIAIGAEFTLVKPQSSVFSVVNSSVAVLCLVFQFDENQLNHPRIFLEGYAQFVFHAEEGFVAFPISSISFVNSIVGS